MSSYFTKLTGWKATGNVFYGTPGTYTFTVPYNVYTITIRVQGAGGSGAGNWERHGDWGAGAGGGSGAYVVASLSVQPYTSFSLVVGVGGASVNGENALGIAGGASSFSTYITCTGGGGGLGGRGPSYAEGGSAGTYSTNAVNVIYATNGYQGTGNATRNDRTWKAGGASPSGTEYGGGGYGVNSGENSGAGQNGFVNIYWG